MCSPERAIGDPISSLRRSDSGLGRKVFRHRPANPLSRVFGACSFGLDPVITWTILGRRNESKEGPQAVDEG